MAISHIAIWCICTLATAGVIIRPFGWPEAIWGVAGAVCLVVTGLLPFGDAITGLMNGGDVYLFLIGMMLLAEAGRKEGFFDWLAIWATRCAKGSGLRLFSLIYAVGVLVTVFLSNDATAVVLTPAVAAAVRYAKVERPLPYLLICAFIANAASFVLPISNPANLVMYGNAMPSLFAWLSRYALASLLSIAATYFVMRYTQRNSLHQAIAKDVPVPVLSRGGKITVIGIGLTACALMLCSAYDLPLGWPTAISGIVTASAALISSRQKPWPMLKGISWDVLPLVGGLFILVEGINKSGLTQHIATSLQATFARDSVSLAWLGGTGVALLTNLVNNLPAGLLTSNVAHMATLSEHVKAALLIGIDLGPNLSVTGSLATILWLTALRREGHFISAWSFLKLGLLTMPPALFLAIAALNV